MPSLPRHHRPQRSARCFVASLLWLCAPAVIAATHTVTQNGDAGIGSLRWAVDQANAGTPGEVQTIRFSLPEAFRRIELTGPALTITHPDVTVEGIQTADINSPQRVVVSSLRANTDGGVLVLAPSALRVRLAHLDFGPSHRQSPNGGCVDAGSLSGFSAVLDIEWTRFEGCLVSTSGRVAGGAVFANGNLSLHAVHSTRNYATSFGGNESGGRGAYGGAVAMESGVLTVVDSVFRDNAATSRYSRFFEVDNGYGGAVAYLGANNGGVLITDSTFMDNTAGRYDCEPGSASATNLCDFQGFGGSVYSSAASTRVTNGVLTTGAARHGAELALQGSGGGVLRRLDVENTLITGSLPAQGIIWLSGSDTRLRQRNSTYHEVQAIGDNATAFLVLDAGAQVDASHSMLFGTVDSSTSSTPVPQHCRHTTPLNPVPLQGSSLIIEDIDPNTGTHSCAFLGTTRVSSAQEAGLPQGSLYPLPTGLLHDNGAPGAPSTLDWSRCAPRDFYNRPRPQDSDGDGDARCSIGAIELETPLTELLSDGFE